MNASPFLSVFPRQLRFWTFHCCLNAAPSFVIALVLLDLWRSPSGIAAMCCGVATFILFYSVVTSIGTPFSVEFGISARALRAGAKVRSFLGAIAFVAFVIQLSATKVGVGSGVEKIFSIGYLADFYCGMMANRILEEFVRIMKPLVLQFGFGKGTIGFFEIYLTTLIEGVILSFLLILISFFALIVLQSKERRKFLQSADFRGESAR